ncbi:MAG: hypothetical protein LBR98_03845 [Syntrophomonadaceae bacterium]|jgi:hypothetical protein|nr:hypothetical protein [Syntrophomonadaceae bacterium]
MRKGELFSVNIAGCSITVCVVDFYKDEQIGEEIVVLAVVDKEHTLHIPVNDLRVINRTLLN